ncbi:MAG TPA: hypothetical protein VLA79_20500, partial [Polyangia bacterium]|nr:hypothetical protein [Polyangia bacterium]
LGWGIYWIAIDKNSAGGNQQYDTRTYGLVLAGAGVAALAGGAVIFFTGRHPIEPTVALGLTPSSILLQGRF